MSGPTPPRPFAHAIVLGPTDTSLLADEEKKAIITEAFAERTGEKAEDLGVWMLSPAQAKRLNEAMAAFSETVFAILDEQRPTAPPDEYCLRLIGLHVANAIAVARACGVPANHPAYGYAHEIGVAIGNAIADQRASAGGSNPER